MSETRFQKLFGVGSGTGSRPAAGNAGARWIDTTGPTETYDDGAVWTALTAGGGGALSYATASLASDVTMTTATTYYDGASVSLAAGTWLVIAHASVLGSTGADDVTIRIWDGTTAYAEGQGETSATGSNILLSASAIIVLGSTTTIKVSATLDTNASGVNGKIKADPRTGSSGAHHATMINAVKIV